MLKKIATHILISAILLLFSAVHFPAQNETQIRFQKGSSSATVSGNLAAGVVKTYVLNAKNGQTMKATLSSPDGKVVFCRSEINHEGGTSYEETTVAGKNYLCIENTRIRGKSSSFKLTVSIR